MQRLNPNMFPNLIHKFQNTYTKCILIRLLCLKSYPFLHQSFFMNLLQATQNFGSYKSFTEACSTLLDFTKAWSCSPVEACRSWTLLLLLLGYHKSFGFSPDTIYVEMKSSSGWTERQTILLRQEEMEKMKTKVMLRKIQKYSGSTGKKPQRKSHFSNK